MRVLIVTDHLDRCHISAGTLDISINFLVPECMVGEIDPERREYVNTCSVGGIQNDSDQYDLVILDIESEENGFPPGSIWKLVGSDGTLITLSWDASWSRVFRAIPGYSHLLRSRQSQKEGVPERWHFSVEPSLRKPRYLVRRGLGQLLPALSRSAIKRWLVRSGGFFLLPHHTVAIASRCKSPSPVIEILRQLMSDSLSDYRIAQSIKSVYISTTQVLLVRASYAGATYFLQFPFTPAAAGRVRNQKEVCDYIHQNSMFTFVPRPVNVQQSSNVLCSIEQGVAGKNVETRFPRLSKRAAEEYYSNALMAMRGIHTRFGSVVRMGKDGFSASIRAKLERIYESLATYDIAAPALESLERYLCAELDGRAVIFSLVHGDFKIGNCLFDNRSTVTGIVDWDMACRDELTLFDLASLRARSIRDRTSLPLAGLVLNPGEYSDEFEAASASYFRATGTDPIRLLTLMWMYWIDRVSKQCLYDADLDEKWVAKNVLPVIARLVREPIALA